MGGTHEGHSCTGILLLLGPALKCLCEEGVCIMSDALGVVQSVTLHMFEKTSHPVVSANPRTGAFLSQPTDPSIGCAP